MAIQTANTYQATNHSDFRSRVIYQSESLHAGGGGTEADIQRVQSINYGFSVPRTDVNQYGQLGQIERVITEIPTVTLDFTYHLSGRTNEARLLGGGGGAGGDYGFMKDINRSASNYDLMKYTIGLANDGQDFRTSPGSSHSNKGIIIDQAGITSYSWTGAVGDIPSATVNAEGSRMEIGTVSNVATPETATTPRVMRPGNVKLWSCPVKGARSLVENTLPAMGFNVVHVQSFTVSVDVPRESIQRLGDRFEYARVITFPIQATMSLEAIVSNQAASNLTDITQTGSDGDPGQDILISCNSQGGTGVPGIGLKFKDAKIEGHSVSSSIGANKSVTMDFAVQVDSGENTETSGLATKGFWVVPSVA